MAYKRPAPPRPEVHHCPLCGHVVQVWSGYLDDRLTICTACANPACEAWKGPWPIAKPPA
jgi:hypothetical protein